MSDMSYERYRDAMLYSGTYNDQRPERLRVPGNDRPDPHTMATLRETAEKLGTLEAEYAKLKAQHDELVRWQLEAVPLLKALGAMRSVSANTRVMTRRLVSLAVDDADA